jgi:Winged helix DNA-binding domain
MTAVGSSAPVALRLAAQLLSGAPAADTAEVAGRLLAIQAQDARGARLAVRARSHGLSAADVDSALTQDRRVVVTWLNRGTLHLVRAEDYWWLHPLTTPPLFTGNARRLAQEGVPPQDAERGVAVIERSLTAEGPLTRAQLSERIAAAGVRTRGQAIVHLLVLASLRGITIRGPVLEREQAYVLVRDWLGTRPAPFDRDRALARLAARYLAGHGPASDRDLAQWAGLPLGDARRGLAAIAHRLAGRDDGLASLAAQPGDPSQPGDPGPGSDSGQSGNPAQAGHPDPPLPPPRLLGAFDPVLLGWSSREPIVGPHGRLVVAGGMFRPFALVRGRAVGTWTMPGGKVALAPFAPLRPADAAALAADATEVERFMGGQVSRAD